MNAWYPTRFETDLQTPWLYIYMKKKKRKRTKEKSQRWEMMIVPCYRCKWIFPFDACSAFLFLPSESRYTGDIPDTWEYIYIYLCVYVCGVSPLLSPLRISVRSDRIALHTTIQRLVLSRSRILFEYAFALFAYTSHINCINDPFLCYRALYVRDGWWWRNLWINKTQKNIGWERVDDYHPLAKGDTANFANLARNDTDTIHLSSRWRIRRVFLLFTISVSSFA